MPLRPAPTSPSWKHLPPALRGSWPRALARARRLRRRLRLALADQGSLARRAIDLLGASVGIVLIAPVMIVAMLAVKVTSKGPLFFPQERVGQNGRSFKLWKLRTMIVGADKLKTQLSSSGSGNTDAVRFKIKRDPRITPVGRVLRKLSLDEMPQLWNVIVGDMTLVGPRPPIWREVNLYDARALRRLEVKPGLTCLWQVGGRSDLSFEQQVDLDLDYIDRIRPFDEILIVARTVPAVITGRGAY
jgi:lipopolysaccharide/colanic/teichoic acid biosynthesis glycosyltransferase